MRVRIDRLIDDNYLTAALRTDVLAGLTAQPKELPPKWFYDEAGSDLFERITELPEYYPTRREREIFMSHAVDIANAAHAETLVELGSGSATKTRLLLDAMQAVGTLHGYAPFDVSEAALLSSVDAISQDYPALDVHGVLGDFEQHLAAIPTGGKRMVAFLGGTIGNLVPAKRQEFLRSLRAGLEDGEALLLGTDLVKDTDRLIAAYDDSAGVTAAFNCNVLYVVNRELKADFDVESFEHVAAWDAENEWIEMRLRSPRRQQVYVGALDLDVSFAAGEQMRTEISAKFRFDRLGAELGSAGFELAERWTDAAGDFAVTLSFAR